MKEEKKGADEIHVSVRNLVEFILRHGDIDNRRRVSYDDAMQEGGRIHRMIQRRMGAEYQAEVSLKYALATDKYMLVVEGRADGVIHNEDGVIIDEIKGTYREIAGIREAAPLHLAQARCYAYMYCLGREMDSVKVRITYCSIPTEELRYFYEECDFRKLEEWFGGLVSAYRKWTDFTWEWRKVRQASIEGLEFPYPYREGQKELAANVYRTIYHKRKLFLEAPTGVGKTLTTIYPAIQAMGRNMGEKLFYLTSKTITRTVADDALKLLRGKGLRLKSVVLTAKEKICFMEETECNPEYCPYARGHYDRVNDAVFQLLMDEEDFNRDKIEEYARKHMVCPFEMCLDMSLYSDAVICDYNYLFDPHVYLKRFFGDGQEGKYIFLIDEAHNLLERGRRMYSAVLWKEQFLELRRELKRTILSEKDIKGKKPKKSRLSGQMTIDMTDVSTDVSYMTPEEENDFEGDVCEGGPKEGRGFEDADDMGCRTGRTVLVGQGYAERLVHGLERCNRVMLALKRECESYRIVESVEEFAQDLMRLQAVMEDYLAQQEEGRLSARDTLLDFYFEVRHFLQMYELLDENYVAYTQLWDDGGFMLKLFCVNPGENLKGRMLKGRSAILFSATLLPIQYYKRLLGGDSEDYEVYAQSVFNPAKHALFVAEDVTSRYARRSRDEYLNIARYIEEIVKCRHGNYMVFCPSYAFLRVVHEAYVDNFGGADRECVLQSEAMSEQDREEFLARFRPGAYKGGGRGDGVLIGFCVLGGIFGEGIDLKNDSLIGAVIVGTGLPQVCSEREILRDYFGEGGEDGFDYAYRYPGMNKVLQAAGRVIRTAEDVGVIVLLDQRFLQPSYRRLFPREWEDFETVTVNTIARRVERFWDEWL